MVFGNVIEIIIRAKDKFSRAFNKANLSMEKFRKSALLVGAAGGIIAVGLAGAIKKAIDAEETFNKFAVVFKKVDKEAEIVAKNLVDNFGLSSQSAKQLLSDTGDLLTGFGFTGQAALDLSQQVNELAVDLASFTNIEGGAERASKALTKALLGERESVKELGIAILEKDVLARVDLLISQGQTFESLRQAKAIATLSIAVEQSKNAIGDFARTSEGAANQLKIAKERFEDLQIEIGKVFLPLVREKLIPALQDTIAFLRTFQERWEAIPEPLRETITVLGIVTVAVSALAVAIAIITFVSSPWLTILALIILALVAIHLAAVGFERLIQENIIEPVKEATSFFEGLLNIIKAVLRALAAFSGRTPGAVEQSISGSFQHGGLVKRTGLAFVHQGERVIPRSRLSGGRGGGGGLTIIIGELVGLDAEDVSRSLREELFNKLSL